MNQFSTRWELVDLMHGWMHGAEPLQYRASMNGGDLQLEIKGKVHPLATDLGYRRPVSKDFSMFFNAPMPMVISTTEEEIEGATAVIDTNGYFRLKVPADESAGAT